MTQWNQVYISLKKCFTNIVQPFLVLGAASPGKDNGIEPIFITFNKVGEHIWRNIGPFLHAELFKILHILRFALMDCPLSIGFKSWDWDGHWKTLILFSGNHFYVDIICCCWKAHIRPSHLAIAPCSSHSYNDVWQTPDAWIWLLSKSFLGATLLIWSLLVWMWCLMVDFETLWPQNTPKVCSTWTGVLGFFFASLAIFLTVRGDNMHLCPLPGKFATIPDVWNFVIIALTVVSGMFNHLLYVFFHTHYLTCVQ